MLDTARLDRTPPGAVAARPQPAVVAWFAAAANYLHRHDLNCPEHHVAHTGKLARAIVLDLALLDAGGGERSWQRAVERARYVVSRLAPDPEHGALIYLPGRLDPRNCSTSAIDSGECTGALAALLAHPRAASLAPEDRAPIERAVERNAETYLRTAVVEKEITNQRLWGAMGLAAAYRVMPRPAWLDALRESVRRSVAEQRSDGSWAYQPDAPRYGAFAGAADTTVYYHGRCLAFLIHVLETAPGLEDGDQWWQAIERGIEFLAGVTAPDGLKPLALEAKRWFWDSWYEAGSNAYDVFVLRRGARRFGRPEWARLADRVWWQLAQHQDPDGGITACRARGVAGFVCRDFHTADLAWTAQVLDELPSPGVAPPAPWPIQSGDCNFAEAGVLRLESPHTVALVRTTKLPRNTQFGGAAGGGALCYAGHAPGWANVLTIDRERALVEGSFVLCPARPNRLGSLRRFLRDNPPGREGRQWLFVARVLLSQRRPLAAATRLWHGWIGPLWESLADPASSHWATTCQVEAGSGETRIESRPATTRGDVPGWAKDVTISRRVLLGEAEHGLQVEEHLQGGARAARICYLIPRAAHDVRVDSPAALVRGGAGGGRLLVIRPAGKSVAVSIRYRL